MTVLNPIEDKRADERLGAYLTRAREARGMSVEDLASATKLPAKSIEAIESGDWKSFPVAAYLRGYLNSVSTKLNIDPKHVLEWYNAEAGNKYASLLSEAPAKPMKISHASEGETKSKSKAVPIVIVILGLAFVVGSHFVKDWGEAKPAADAAKPAVAEQPVAPAAPAEETEVPEGAEVVAVDSSRTDSAAAEKKSSDSVVTQAQVDEALKKSELPASATIFISSSSKKDGKDASVSNNGKTKFELVGSGEMRSWVGLKHHEEDGVFLKEANISRAGAKMLYNADDTLFVVIGEPRAISKMYLNGVETALPEMKFGRVTRFRIFDGKVLEIPAVTP